MPLLRSAHRPRATPPPPPSARLQDLRLHIPELLLPHLSEYLRHGLARELLNQLVRVEEIVPECLAEQTAHGALAGTHHSEQVD